MHSFQKDSHRFAISKLPSLGIWSGSFRSTRRDGESRLRAGLKFLGGLPLLLATFLVNLLASIAMIVVPLLLIPLAILTPVLLISASVLIVGFVLNLLGVGL